MAYWLIVRDQLTDETIEKHSFRTRKLAEAKQDRSDYERIFGRRVRVEIEAHPSGEKM